MPTHILPNHWSDEQIDWDLEPRTCQKTISWKEEAVGIFCVLCSSLANKFISQIENGAQIIHRLPRFSHLCYDRGMKTHRSLGIYTKLYPGSERGFYFVFSILSWSSGVPKFHWTIILPQVRNFLFICNCSAWCQSKIICFFFSFKDQLFLNFFL